MKQTELKGVKKMVRSKFMFEENPSFIREARVSSKLSQNQMASALDYAHTTYGEIERGRRPVRVETATRIAGLLHQSVEKLFSPHKKKFIAKRVAK